MEGKIVYQQLETDDIEMLGRCTACFKSKRTSKYCRLMRQHQGVKAAPCPSCFEQGISVSTCRLAQNHCGPGVTWRTSAVNETEKFNLPQCCSELKCVNVSSTEATHSVDPSCLIAHAGPQAPQDYATGFLYPYSTEKWETWLKQFSLQTNTDYKLCTGRNSNKEADTGVLRIGTKRQAYKITWRQSYNCSRGGKPRYKVSRSTHPKPNLRVRNAPGSRLMDCKATLNVHLLKVDSGDPILQVSFPLASAHTNHSPTSLADLHSHKPLPEVVEKVESLISHSHLNQINLKLTLRDWTNHELIPDHLQQGILTDHPSEYDRRYYPTVEDLKNMSRKVIRKIRHNMFDQDALESFLHRESNASNELRFFLRKYTTGKGEEGDANTLGNDEEDMPSTSARSSPKGEAIITVDESQPTGPSTSRIGDVSQESAVRQKIEEAVIHLKHLDAKKHDQNLVTGEGEEAEEGTQTEAPESTFLLVMQTQHQQELLAKYGNVVTLMDGVYRTTKYGFPCFFVTIKTSLGLGRVVATIIPQYENEQLLTEGLQVLKRWNPKWSPHFSMTDKSSVELQAIGNVHPSCIRLLCDFHRAQAWERWVNKSANGVLPQHRDIVLSCLKDLAYAITEAQFQEVLKSIQEQPWYVNNAKFRSYLESEWLTCIPLWAHAYRQVFHCGVDTNNITESFNNVLRKRYLPLRQDTTIFALVQILVEVVFPEQEVRYIQATIKQTSAYRRPRYHLPSYLNNISHTAQSICLLNMERAKAIPKSHMTQQELIGVYSLLSSSSAERSWTVNIPAGSCTCPSFLSSQLPCKHIFAVFHHYPEWTWDDLPKELTNSTHMTLDQQAIAQEENCTAICNARTTEDDHSEVLLPSLTTSTTTGLLPSKTSEGKQVYRLQKSIEEAVGQCRTLAFLTNDLATLQTALQQCKTVIETLASSATTSLGLHTPPVFHAIAKAGVEQFKKDSKRLHRVGAKRKCTNPNQPPSKNSPNEAASASTVQQEDTLTSLVKRKHGRPRLKRLQRKRPALPRQVSSPNKKRMLEAAAILRRERKKKARSYSTTIPAKQRLSASELLQGLTTPYRFIKLDPSIPDLSIPELQQRVELEKNELHIPYKAKVQVRKGGNCGTCTGCKTFHDCGKCKMCLDKTKFGGPGRKKQRCLQKKCTNTP